MIEPLPNCFSICASAAASALPLLSSMGSPAVESVILEPFDGSYGVGIGVFTDFGGDYGIERTFDPVVERSNPEGRIPPKQNVILPKIDSGRTHSLPDGLHHERRPIVARRTAPRPHPDSVPPPSSGEWGDARRRAARQPAYALPRHRLVAGTRRPHRRRTRRRLHAAAGLHAAAAHVFAGGAGSARARLALGRRADG